MLYHPPGHLGKEGIFMSTLTDKLASNIDRLEADAAATLGQSDMLPALVLAIQRAGLSELESDCWHAGYYAGLMRALEVLKDYED
jgi:hypothetical protein